MVIYDRDSHTCEIYEIKHSDKVVVEQAKHLLDEEKCSLVTRRYGEIKGKYVVYRGKNEEVGDIQYINVEQFLSKLNKNN